MTKPVPDKDAAVESPDEVYLGAFEHSARFDAHFDDAGISLSLDRGGEGDVRQSVSMHFQYALFAEILRDLAGSVTSFPVENVEQRDALRGAAQALYLALSRGHANDAADLTPEEEVRLLHILE